MNKNDYEKVFLGYAEGIKKVSNRVYLSPPSFDCGWYWGFGYLSTTNSHYHVKGLQNQENNLHDGLKKDFGNTLRVNKEDMWTFSELFKTFYNLRETAEVLGRGGSHYSENPCKDIIINTDEVTRINSKVLPSIFKEIYKILSRYQNNKGIKRTR
jgi:hypothetical protein